VDKFRSATSGVPGLPYALTPWLVCHEAVATFDFCIALTVGVGVRVAVGLAVGVRVSVTVGFTVGVGVTRVTALLFP
jgi:hypothetical protein